MNNITKICAGLILLAQVSGCASTYSNLVSGSSLGAQEYRPSVLVKDGNHSRYEEILKICRDVAVNKQITASVTRTRDRAVLLDMPAHTHNADALKVNLQSHNLSSAQQSNLLRLYRDVAPSLYYDLTEYVKPDAEPMSCGVYTFKCGKELLLTK